MRLFLLLMVLVSVCSVSALTQPNVSVSDFIDLSEDDVLLRFNFSTDESNETISYFLFLDGSVHQEVFSTPLELIVSEGNHSVFICAYAGNISNCSFNVSFQVVAWIKPIIIEVPSRMAIIPIYGDASVSKRVFGVTVEDPHSVDLEVSFVPSDDDYYGDDFENITKTNCNEDLFVSNRHYFNCSVAASYKMQAGYYDMSVRANNSFGSVSRTISEGLMIYNLLSANISKPVINFNDTYGGWIDADPPIRIKNLGNVLFSKVYVAVNDIECTNYEFSKEKILIGLRDNRAAASQCINETEFDLEIKRSELEDLFVFVNNNDEKTPSNCKYKWAIRVKYLFDEVDEK
jgi:hypothetical protein